MLDIAQQLQKVDLSKPEISVYLYLLENGLSSTPDISKGTRILRPNVYNILRSLSGRGLIDSIPRGKRKVYAAKDPSALVKNMEQRTETISQLLPDLRDLYKAEKNKPTIKYLAGPTEIKNAFTEVVKTDEILFIMSNKYIFEAYPAEFVNFRKAMMKQGTFIRQILTKGISAEVSEIVRQELKGYYDFRVMDEKYEDTPSVIRIWNDNVAIVTFEEPVYGTVITNKIIAGTFKAIFETMWKAGAKS